MLAALLALLLLAMALPGAGRIVTDTSTDPPTRQVVWGVRECAPSVGLALVSLACIYVSMWRHWDFEIVGWALLGVFILGGVVSGM